MLRGKCLEPDVLPTDELFYLFPADKWPDEPKKKKIVLDRGVIYQAHMIWCWPAEKRHVGKEFFTIVRGSGSHVDFYTDEALKKFAGSLPVHWFNNYRKLGEPIPEELPDPEAKCEEAHEQVEQLSLF